MGSDPECLMMSAFGSRVYVRRPEDFKETIQGGMSVTVRPEHILINPKEMYRNSFPGIVTERQFQGSFIAFYIKVGGAELIVKKLGLTKEELGIQPAVGETVQLGFTPEVCTVTQ